MTTATTNATKANALAGDTSRAEQDTMKTTLRKVTVNIASEGLLGASEVCQEDENVAELQDTVARA
ncbi:unnamed protein product, partial [Ascophyllum nodosum]